MLSLLKSKKIKVRFVFRNNILLLTSRLLFYFLFTFSFVSISVTNGQESVGINKSKLFTIGGSINMTTGYYYVKGIPPRYRTWNYQFSGNLTIDVFGLNLPFSIALSDQNRTYSQPFNNFGVSPRYKWITAHFGYRNLTFSPFTLAGHIFWGAGVELNPWLFRISAMYGSFKKAVHGDTSNLLIFPPTYRRDGYAFKIGFGSSSSYVDFIFLRARDDKNSLDTTSQKFVNPEENLVFGISSKLRFSNNLRMEIDGGASSYTLNLNSETINIDTFPKVPKFFSKIYTVRLSTQFTTAIQSSLIFSNNLFMAKLSYKRIDPDYKSMGMYFSESDVQSLTASLSLPIFQRKVRLNGSIGYQHDNLLNNKAKTTKRIVGSAGLSFFLNNFGADLSYSTYGIVQSKGLAPIIDSLRYSRVNQNANLNLRLTLPKDAIFWNFSVNSFVQKTSGDDPNAKSILSSISYGGNFSVQYSNSSRKMNFGLTSNILGSETGQRTTMFYGPSVSFSKMFNKIGLTAQLGYHLSYVDKVSNGGIFNGILSSSFQVDNHNEIRMDINFQSSTQKIQNNFNEVRISMGYSYRF